MERACVKAVSAASVKKPEALSTFKNPCFGHPLYKRFICNGANPASQNHGVIPRGHWSGGCGEGRGGCGGAEQLGTVVNMILAAIKHPLTACVTIARFSFNINTAPIFARVQRVRRVYSCGRSGSTGGGDVSRSRSCCSRRFGWRGGC